MYLWALVPNLRWRRRRGGLGRQFLLLVGGIMRSEIGPLVGYVAEDYGLSGGLGKYTRLSQQHVTVAGVAKSPTNGAYEGDWPG